MEYRIPVWHNIISELWRDSFADLLESGKVIAIRGGMLKASMVGRGICSVSFHSICSACLKARGGSCKVLVDSLRTWKHSGTG